MNSERTLYEQRAGKPSTELQPPLTDSPWFWLYLFSTFGLIVAIVFAPKITTRQRELDLEATAKRRSFDDISRRENLSLEKTDPTELIDDTGQGPVTSSFKFRFYTLLFILGVLTAGGWAGLWWRRFRPTPRGGG